MGGSRGRVQEVRTPFRLKVPFFVEGCNFQTKISLEKALVTPLHKTKNFPQKKIVEIEDQQYPCSNKDQLNVRLIQAVLIPIISLSWLKSRPLLYYVDCVMWWGVCTRWQSRI
jgi:hypothetical protein